MTECPEIVGISQCDIVLQHSDERPVMHLMNDIAVRLVSVRQYRIDARCPVFTGRVAFGRDGYLFRGSFLLSVNVEMCNYPIGSERMEYHTQSCRVTGNNSEYVGGGYRPPNFRPDPNIRNPIFGKYGCPLTGIHTVLPEK